MRISKSDFPIFSNQPHLVYLDTGATSLKPAIVIAKEREYYEEYSANVFRGIYKLSERATEEYERVRSIVADFINANSSTEIVFTRNTTESLNLIAYSYLLPRLKQGDEVVTTVMEHHSNFVPFQRAAQERQAVFKVIPITQDGTLNLSKLDSFITPKTKLVSLVHVSNVLGTVNPVDEITARIKKINPHTVVVVDAAQSAAHIPIDVEKMGCDFLAFSSHKMYGPTGAGVLWGKSEHLEKMEPFMTGGEVVSEVTNTKTTYKPPPHRFEAGTPHIAGVIGVGAAVDYINTIGFKNIIAHESFLTMYAYSALKKAFGSRIRIFGPSAKKRAGIIAFSFPPYHPHDIASILDQEEEICIRAGHHCAMPLHNHLGVPSTARVSFGLYSTKADIERLIKGLRKVDNILGGNQ